MLLPGLYVPDVLVVGFTQEVPLKANEELHAHIPGLGEFDTDVVLS
jgi:hypothetical protein